jgi:hypothetical protein
MYFLLLLLCRSSLVWCSPICSFFLLDAEPFEFYLGRYPIYLYVPVHFLLFLKLFHSFKPYFKVFDHFKLIWVQGERQGSRFSLLHMNIWFSQQHFLNVISIVCFGLLCQKSIHCGFVGLCLHLPFWFIGLPVCFCANTMLFLLLWLWTIVWSQGLWCLQQWTFCSELLWLNEVFCLSICISVFIFLFPRRISLEFW